MKKHSYWLYIVAIGIFALASKSMAGSMSSNNNAIVPYVPPANNAIVPYVPPASNAPIPLGPPPAYDQQTQSPPPYQAQPPKRAQYYQSTQQRSGKCLFYAGRAASICKRPKGFYKYREMGCIDDVSSASNCIISFCTYNCLDGRTVSSPSSTCPADGSELKNTCLEMCKNVNLGNSFLQDAMADCLGKQNVLESQAAINNESLRAQTQSYDRQMNKQSANAVSVAQKLIRDLNSLSRARLNQLRNLGNTPQEINRSNDMLLNTTSTMIEITKNIYRGIPQMTQQDSSRVKDAIKKSWFGSNAAMKEYLDLIGNLQRSLGTYSQIYATLPMDRDFLDPNEIR